MGVITLPWSMEQDRINQIKANSVHVDDNFNTLLAAVNNKLEADGSILPTANLPMGGYKITNMATPTASGDAATKGYVDSKITAAKVAATTSTLGQVIIGNNISVDSSGKISVTLGSTATTSAAQQAGIRPCIFTNSLPSTGVDGVWYGIYSLS